MDNTYSFSVLLLQLLLYVKWVDSYEIPEVRLQALDPSGLSISVPDTPGVTSVEFSGTANGVIYQASQGRAWGGQWTLSVPDLALNEGDVVSYRVYVTLNDDDTYYRDGLSYTVRGKMRQTIPPPTTTSTTTTTETYYVPPPPPTSPPTTLPPVTECPRSVTTIRGQTVCAGEVIFDERFHTLNRTVWRVEHKIPTDHPEYPFVTYHDSQVRVYRRKGTSTLVIEPRPQSLMPNFNKDRLFTQINMGQGCTGRTTEQCRFVVESAEIVRPVASGRITTNQFAFKYGRVDVVAKLPQGDWVYPELLLEEASLWSAFSGFMKIAFARGNKSVQDTSGNEIGNELLYGGVAYHPNCGDIKFHSVNRSHPSAYALSANERQTWPDSYHTYTLIWTPSGISFEVDGEALGPEIKPPFQGKTCDPRRRSTDMAPFDRDYKLSFGVAAGGVTAFQDDLMSLPDDTHIYQKPWKNQGRKAMLDFFNSQKIWYSTWEQSAKLFLRSVKVTAL